MKETSRDKAIVKSLMDINSLYANPSMTSRYQKNKAYANDPEKLYKKLGFQGHIVTYIVMAVVYGIFFSQVDFRQLPYMLDVTFISFLLICIFLQFTFFYNIIYENKDIETYMSIPIDERLVYRSKVLTSLISGGDTTFVILPLVIFFCLNNGYNIVLSVVVGLIDTAIFMALIVVLTALVMDLLATTGLLEKFKQKIIIGISMAVSMGSLIYVLLIQYYSRKMMEEGMSGDPHYMFLSRMFVNPLYHIIFDLIAGAAVAVALLALEKKSSKNFYRYIRRIKSGDSKGKDEGKKKEGKAGKVGRNLTSSLFKYNAGLIGENNIINMSILQPAILPIVLVVNLIIQGDTLKSYIETFAEPGALGIGIGFMVGVLTEMAYGNLSSMIISLEGEDHDYLMSLPLNYRHYAGVKLIFSVLAGGSAPLAVGIVLCIVFGLSPLDYIMVLAVGLAVLFGGAGLWMIYDQKHLYTQWQSTADLVNRGNRVLQIGLMIVVMVLFLIAGALVVMYPVLAWIIGVASLIFVTISMISWRNFFKKL